MSQGELVGGEWKLGHKLGTGSFATVRKGVHIDSKTGRESKPLMEVAVKIFEKVSSSGIDLWEIEQEISIMKSLEHPGVLRLIDVVVDEDLDAVFIVMELAHKELTELMGEQEAGYMDEDTARTYLWQIADALGYLHKNNVAHRDVKFENLLLQNSGPRKEQQQLKLADFGMSRLLTTASEQLQTRCGSTRYISPEMARLKPGDGYSGFAMDVWATGVLLFAMLTGMLPFPQPDLGDMLRAIAKCNYKIPSEAGLSSQAEDLIRKMLCKDPTKRITIKELRQHPWMTAGKPEKHSKGARKGSVGENSSRSAGSRKSSTAKKPRADVPGAGQTKGSHQQLPGAGQTAKGKKKKASCAARATKERARRDSAKKLERHAEQYTAEQEIRQSGGHMLPGPVDKPARAGGAGGLEGCALSEQLVSLVVQLVEQFPSARVGIPDWASIVTSPKIEHLMEMIDSLEQVNINALDARSRKAFLVNCWNAMFLSLSIEAKQHPGKKTEPQRNRFYRGNVWAFSNRAFNLRDLRKHVVDTTADPRLLIALCTHTQSSAVLQLYEPRRVEKQLTLVTRRYVADFVTIDEDTGSVSLPLLFRENRSEFVRTSGSGGASDSELLEWVAEYLPEVQKASLMRLLLKTGAKPNIRYSSAKWTPDMAKCKFVDLRQDATLRSASERRADAAAEGGGWRRLFCGCLGGGGTEPQAVQLSLSAGSPAPSYSTEEEEDGYGSPKSSSTRKAGKNMKVSRMKQGDVPPGMAPEGALSGDWGEANAEP